jgi:hypothetical protein
MSSSSTGLQTPEDPGSASGAPNLPAGFTDTLTNRYIDAGELRQHGVIGDGPWSWQAFLPASARADAWSDKVKLVE